MHRCAVHVLGLGLLALLGAGRAAAACDAKADPARWLVKVEHLSTYPSGSEWNTTLTLHDDGCLVVDAPKALRRGGGVTHWQMPPVHLKAFAAVVAEDKLAEVSAETLLGEMKHAGHDDLSRLGADSVTDAPHTVIQFRDPATGKASAALQVYALSDLTLPEALPTLRSVQELVRALDRMASIAASARDAAAPHASMNAPR